MTTTIDFRTLPVNVPSLCIPRVYPNINEARIRKIFDELCLGLIDHVDIISKTTEKGEKYNRVFIHFQRWFTDGNASIARERLVNGKDIKIIYDEPWFWKVSAYREQASSVSREPRQNQQKYSQKKPTILLEDEDQKPRQAPREAPRQAPREAPREAPRQAPREAPRQQGSRPCSSKSYDDDRRIKTSTRQEERSKEAVGGFKKVTKADSENRKAHEVVPVRPTQIAPTLLALPLTKQIEEVKQEVKQEKVEEEDEMRKQKVPPKKKLRAIASNAKKPNLKVEEEPVKIKQDTKEDLEEGEIA